MKRLVFLAIAAAVVVACSSFGTDGADSPATPAESDAGDRDATPTGTSSGTVSSSSGGLPPKGDASPFTCSTAFQFCDDFTRQPKDVVGAWTSLQTKAADDLAIIEDGAFHLFAAEVGVEAERTETTRAYLVRNLDGCDEATVTIDLDFKLDDKGRDSNLTAITTATADRDYYTSLALIGANIVLVTSDSKDSPLVLHGTVPAPDSNVWTHASLTFDVKNGRPSARFGTITIGNDTAIAPKGVMGCRFTIGNDYIASGPKSSRWYDNVTAVVEPSK